MGFFGSIQQTQTITLTKIVLSVWRLGDVHMCLRSTNDEEEEEEEEEVEEVEEVKKKEEEEEEVEEE
ncbi:hypothetical protein M0804_006484 [Polistes exclamans]|nr:hypothetical protein M0804_006484 [Polistes exclamans]